MKKISIGTSSFETLIEDGYIYVDKTQIIHQLIHDEALYFLARPRRFGKTLLLSTLKALFEGKRDLFKELWIDSSNYSWEKYPVLSFDSSRLDTSTPIILEKELIYNYSYKLNYSQLTFLKHQQLLRASLRDLLQN